MWQRIVRGIPDGVIVLASTNCGFFALGEHGGPISPLEAEAIFIGMALVVVLLPSYLRHRFDKEL